MIMQKRRAILLMKAGNGTATMCMDHHKESAHKATSGLGKMMEKIIVAPFFSMPNSFSVPRKSSFGAFLLSLLGISFMMVNFVAKWRPVEWSAKATVVIAATEEVPIADVKRVTKKVRVTLFNSTYDQTPKFNINGSFNGLHYYPSTLYREYLVIAHLRNVFISSNGGIISDNKKVKIYPYFTPKIGEWPIVGSYDRVIYPFSANGWVPGHWMNDGLCGLIQLPKKMLNKSRIMHQFQDKIVKQQLEMLGYDKDLIATHTNEWVFVKHAYVIYGLESLNCFNVVGLPLLAKMFRERLSLDLINATDYCMSNRPKGPRHIENFDELLATANSTFPDKKWYSFETNEINISETARKYAKCKIIVMPCGSNCINTVFMAPKTGVVLLMANYVDYPNFGWSMVLNIWSVGISHYDWLHFSHGGKANIPFCIHTIKYLMHAVDFGKWPTNADFIDVFELERTKIRMQKYPKLYDFNNGPAYSIADFV